MSMMPPPFSTDDPSQGGIPAADPGAGAPEPAPGFGVEGEEPDRPEEATAPVDGSPSTDERTPFRTPDPREVGR